jgi:ubiquinone/menaquinone biosynthesis C-methylase UbiE
MRPLEASRVVQAQHKADQDGVSNVELLHGDVTGELVTAALRDAAAFDVITCSSAMIYLPDVPAALRQFASWLAPGGKLVFNSPQVLTLPPSERDERVTHGKASPEVPFLPAFLSALEGRAPVRLASL